MLIICAVVLFFPSSTSTSSSSFSFGIFTFGRSQNSAAVHISHSHIEHVPIFILRVIDTVARMLRLPSMTNTKLRIVENYMCGHIGWRRDSMPFARRPKGFNTINEQFSFNAEYDCGNTSAHSSTRLGDSRQTEYIHVNLFKFMLQITTDFVYGPSHFFPFFFILFCCRWWRCWLSSDPMPRPPRHLAKNVMRQPSKILKLKTDAQARLLLPLSRM